MKTDSPVCSIIIVNWNGGSALRTCLESLRRFEDVHRLQIIVSDNGSSDGSAALVLAEFPEATLIENGRNLGFAGGNNAALRTVAAPYTLLLNPDMEFIAPGGLDAMLAFMEQNPRAGVAGCMVINADGGFMKQCRRGYPDPLTAFYKASGLIRLFPSHPRIGKYFYAGIPADRAMEVDAVSGSFMLARTEALRQAGGLCEDYFMYVEDVDLCARVRDAGWRVFYAPLMRIVHHGGACVDRRPRKNVFYHYHMTRSHIILYAKDARKNGAAWRLAFFLIVLRYAALSLVLGNGGFFGHLSEFIGLYNGKKAQAGKEL